MFCVYISNHDNIIINPNIYVCREREIKREREREIYTYLDIAVSRRPSQRLKSNNVDKASFEQMHRRSVQNGQKNVPTQTKCSKLTKKCANRRSRVRVSPVDELNGWRTENAIFNT